VCAQHLHPPSLLLGSLCHCTQLPSRNALPSYTYHMLRHCQNLCCAACCACAAKIALVSASSFRLLINFTCCVDFSPQQQHFSKAAVLFPTAVLNTLSPRPLPPPPPPPPAMPPAPSPDSKGTTCQLVYTQVNAGGKLGGALHTHPSFNTCVLHTSNNTHPITHTHAAAAAGIVNKCMGAQCDGTAIQKRSQPDTEAG